MSATLGLVAVTYRGFGLATAPVAAATHVTGMTWLGEAFASGGELAVLRKYGLAALDEGAVDAAFDWTLAAASLVDAPIGAYREALSALRVVCSRTGRDRAGTTIDWYLGDHPEPRDPFDAAWTRLSGGDANTAALVFDRAGLPAHAALACERAGAHRRARDHYKRVASASSGLSRALAVLGVARLSASSAARDRAMTVAIAHAKATLGADTPHSRDIADALDRQSWTEGEWEPSTNPAADRFRFAIAPPWIAPMLDEEAGADIPRVAASLLLSRPALERRVTPAGADFALRRWMLTRLLALETQTASGERRAHLEGSLALRLQQVGDARVDGRTAARLAA